MKNSHRNEMRTLVRSEKLAQGKPTMSSYLTKVAARKIEARDRK